jgi:catechol 2,3-dioxygenase-like lactoylglutathione lyase family enzyme
MRNVFVAFVCGVIVTLAVKSGRAEDGRITALNHVAVAVTDFDKSARFQNDVLGFRQAFSFGLNDGNPRMAYEQISRNTFIELQPATPTRPAGLSHIGLEVENIDALVTTFRSRGLSVTDATVSPRTRSKIAMLTTPEGISIELLEFGPDSLHRRVMEMWK